MRKEYFDKVAVVLAIIMFLVFLSTLSVSLDDEDSVHFALGLKDFNVTKYQPHPPGFPVYIGIGMVFNAFLSNEILALTLMSALFGALSVIVFYLLAREMFTKEIAFFASVLMAVTPLFWLNSVKAMSDMAGLFFTLLSMLFIYRYIRQDKSIYLYIGAVLVGISAGVRIHSAFILLPVLAYGLIYRKSDMRTYLKTGSIIIISVLVWLIPLLIMTGIPEYMSVAGNQFSYRIDRPDISSMYSDIGYGDVINRFVGFAYFFLLGGYGINIYSFGALSGALLFLIIALVVVFIKRSRVMGITTDNRRTFLILGIVPYLFAVFFMLPPFNPRYLLILIPLVSLVLVSAIHGLRGNRIRYLMYSGMILLLLSHSVFLALIATSTPSPPVQMINYVNQNYRAGDNILLDGFALKYFIYYQTELAMLSYDSMGCDAIIELLSGGQVVITNSPANDCEGIRTELVAEFHRDPRVHIKRSRIRMYRLFLKQRV